jgi:2',3'-cyclic-nucleotide 2'-phosphodiesterase (5'-nucleotidase family)
MIDRREQTFEEVNADISGGVGRLIDSIRRQAARDDLAAVILHINDTYRIEPRLPDVPGLARFAQLVKTVRGEVLELVGEDRVLVVHSGDFLSPSYMTTKLNFGGAQMVDLLNRCGVDFATIGNHEFDVSPDQLKSRFLEARFELVCSNLCAPADSRQLKSLVFWPEDRPFLAIAALAGSQTIAKATRAEFAFTSRLHTDALEEVVARAQRRAGIGALLLLTHMDREEDKEVQHSLAVSWHKDAGCFVAGGHDHDISWQEPDTNSLLCKNLSNARTATALILSKSAVAAPRAADRPLQEDLDECAEVKIMSRWEEIRREWDAGRPPDGARRFEEIVEDVVTRWRSIAPRERDDFTEAFATTLREAASDLGRRATEEDDYLHIAERRIYETACANTAQPYRFRERDAVHMLEARDLSRLPPDPSAERAVEGWVSSAHQSGVSSGAIVADFTADLQPNGRLNAQDEALRSSSTDFGNFCADAVQTATGAAVALLNAGSFRIDDALGPTITTRDLQETFLYDRDDAIVIADLTSEEISRFCGHAQKKSGQGAFLQVSRGLSQLPATGNVKAAIVWHMLLDDEDGFQSLLALSRGCRRQEVPSRVTAAAGGSLIALVSAGAKHVRYDAGPRLMGSAESDPIENAQNEFCDAIDRFTGFCSAARMPDSGLSLLEFDPQRSPLSQELASERQRVRIAVLRLLSKGGFKWVATEFSERVARSERRYKRGTAYGQFLGHGLRYFDLRNLGRRIRDEEGLEPIEGARDLAVAGADASAPASETSPEHFVELFVEAVNDYAQVCALHGIDSSSAIDLLSCGLKRSPPAEDLSHARYRVRVIPFILLVNHGAERVRRDFKRVIARHDHRRAKEPRYSEYLASVLDFFGSMGCYHLLVDEEIWN